MYRAGQDEFLFFDRHLAALPLYESFAEKVFELFPTTSLRVQKTQITFSDRHVYACVSFARVKHKADLPDPYITVTLGLPYPLQSDRVAVRTEPYPGRWTTHLVIGLRSEMDDEFFTWVRQAHDFSAHK